MKNLKLEIRRTSYWIYNYEPKFSPTLEKSLGVYDIFLKRYVQWGFCYDSESKILKIPIGVDIKFIMDKLCSDNIVITDITNSFEKYVESRRVNKVKSKIIIRDIHQKEAVEFIMAEHSSDKLRSQRLCQLDTGFGKTVCSIEAALRLNMPTIITSVNLSQQWLDRILAFSTAKLNEDVFYLKTWDDILKIMKNKPKGTFFIIGLDAMSAGLRRDPNFLQNFYEMFGIGLQIFDEAHSSYIKIIQVLVNINVERVLLLSATPGRSERSQDNLYKKLFRENVPSYGENTHDINKFNIIKLDYKTKPSFGDMFRIAPKRGVSAVGYFKYILKQESRIHIFMKIIIYFATRTFLNYNNNPNKKILIYIQNLELIKIIKKNLQDYYSNKTFIPTIGDYTGNVEKGERYKELNNNIIITTMSNREGLDIKDLIMIINFIPISSSIILKQIRGRLRDPLGWYIDITDIGVGPMFKQQEIRFFNHKRCARKIVHYKLEAEGITKIN